MQEGTTLSVCYHHFQSSRAADEPGRRCFLFLAGSLVPWGKRFLPGRIENSAQRWPSRTGSRQL